MPAISLQDAAALYSESLRTTVQRHALLFISEGALQAVAGLLVIIYAFSLASPLAVPLGWLLIAMAVLQSIILFGLRSTSHAGFQLLSVVIALFIGFLLLRDPTVAQQTITLLVCIFLMLHGVARLALGLGVRPLPQWIWVVAGGALNIVLALVLVVNLPDPPAWLVGLLLGIGLIGDGLAIGYFAWTGKWPVRAADKGASA